MKHFLAFFFLFATLSAEDPAPQPTETQPLFDSSQYEKKLWKEVEKQQERVAELTAALSRRDAIYPAATVAEYKNAVQMLD
ncbi:MAG: hypothetical protein KDK65_07400, partial [Chlamydiia bacterium]|nr:hypothetical protein [Chlamydiia bacterium]